MDPELHATNLRHGHLMVALTKLVSKMTDYQLAALILEAQEIASECVCRTTSCGHGASAHCGPGGACVVCQKVCWS